MLWLFINMEIHICETYTVRRIIKKGWLLKITIMDMVAQEYKLRYLESNFTVP